MIAFPNSIQTTSGYVAVADTETLADSETLADTERLGDEIARLAAHLHAATYHLLVMIREFDEREGWGAVDSCPAPIGFPGEPASAQVQPVKRSG